MVRRSWFVALAATLLGSIAGAPLAEACVCGQAPACAAVWQADAVFVGTVTERVQFPTSGSVTWTAYKVSVDQRLHGQVHSSVVTMTPFDPPSISTCDYDRFQVGRRYIIYARRTPDGRWTTSECSGTKLLQDALEDLDYIASLPGAEPTGRVYGRIDRTVVDPAKPGAYRTVPATGVTVTLASTSTRVTATTDSDGKIDLSVPPGNYTTKPVVPETIRVFGDPLAAAVPATGCASVYFLLTANGRIEGRVVRADGTPASATSVEVIPADLPPGTPPPDATMSPSRYTDKNGQFSIDAILPGRYVIAVNGRYGAQLSAPYPTTYFPNGAREDARVVEIGEGERKTGFTIVVNPLRETTISGVVVFDDDERPAADANVIAVPVEHRNSQVMGSSKTNASGAFELRVLRGMSYVIRTTIRTDAGPRQTETVVFVDERLVGVRLRIAR